MIEYDMNENETTLHEPVPALEQYPYEDEHGVKHDDLICHYPPDGKSVINAVTGEIYDKAIDCYPCNKVYFVYEEEMENALQCEAETPENSD